MPVVSDASASPDAYCLSFQELVAARAELGELVLPHTQSVNFFASDRGFVRRSTDVLPSSTPFKPRQVPRIRRLGAEAHLSGITTTLTCFESLAEAATRSPDAAACDKRRFNAFVQTALAHPDDWYSEKAIRRYCIVRSVAPIWQMAGSVLKPAERGTLASLLREVWQAVGDAPESRGVYETAPPVEAIADADQAGTRSDIGNERAEGKLFRYPPNAFLTYWALRGLPAIERFEEDHDLMHRVNMAKSWLLGVVAREMSLQFDETFSRDPQQLAWALCGVVISDTRPMADRSEGTRDVLRAGLGVFFKQQRSDGSWTRGRPLFHYRSAGNAYCYVFETLAELLGLALDGSHPAAAELRAELLVHLGDLLDAKDHLLRTRRELQPGLFGWSSNHHPHLPAPESWATATAYRFLQFLRRLIALETRRTALRELGSIAPRRDMATLKERGQTWDTGQGSAGDILASLFVHPTLTEMHDETRLDPDRTLFADNRARSAILFGPPGTGKTNLAEAVAGALRWEFVEITAAEFLDRGFDQVSARADEIFRQLMELDRSVVLLDEIDELLRSRTGQADSVERFFTATMLPRLTRLWKMGRVIFFVNTNSVELVDPAIRRSQRFDATIFVMPPSLTRKLAMLTDARRSFVNPTHLDQILQTYDQKPSIVGEEDARVGWFPFLRFEQMQRLRSGGEVNVDAFLDAVVKLGGELPASDWAASIDAVRDETRKDWNPLQLMVAAYKAERLHQRIDGDRVRLVRDVRSGVARDGTLPAGLNRAAKSGYLVQKGGFNIPGLNGAAEWAGT